MTPAPVTVISSADEFAQFISGNAKMTSVIHFWASWSEPCVQLNENLDLLASEADSDKIVFAKIEAESVPEVSLAYKIVAVPTIVFIKNNKTFDRIDGFHPAELTKKVRQYSSGAVPVLPAAAPVPKAETKEELNKRLEKLTKQSRCVLFMKGSPDEPKCGFSRQTVQLLNDVGADYSTFDILTDDAVRQGLKEYSQWPTFPQIYVDGELIGGLDILREELESGDLAAKLPKKASLNDRLKYLIHKAPIMVFMKGEPSHPQCKFSRALMEILGELNVKFDHFDILADEDVRQGLKEYSKWPSYPQVYVKGELIGGLDIIKELKESGELAQALSVD